jgi:hypothetical protein
MLRSPSIMSNSNHPAGPVASEDRSSSSDARQFSPSAARNCKPIREVLTRVLPRKGIVKRYSFDPELSDFQRAFANAGAATFTWGG